MNRIVLPLIIMFGCVCLARAQSEVRFSQYNEALGYYNPASAGRSGNLDVLAMYNIMALGYSSKSLFVSASMPFYFMKREYGIGVAILSDTQSDFYKDLSAGLQYAYLKKLGKGKLRVGIQLGMVSRSVGPSGNTQVITPDEEGGSEGGSSGSSGDEAIPTTVIESKTFDANFGLYYATDKWYVGAGVTHILEPEIDDEMIQTYIERGYNFIGGYNIRMKNPLLELQPSVFAQTNFNMYQVI